MSRVTYRGRDHFTPRNRNQWQRNNAGRFADHMRFRKGSVGILFVFGLTIGLAVVL